MGIETSTELRILHDNIRECHNCNLYRDMPEGCHPVPGIGPSDAKIMIVGEALGEDESLMGEPFMGRAGKQLDAIIIDAGLERKDLYITNAVRCRPTETNGRFKKNRPPTEEEIKACKHWLWKEIQKIQPQAIVTLGKTPTGLLLALKPTFTLAKIVGRKFNVKYMTGVVVPAYHPSYLMQHGKDKIQDTVDIFKSVREHVQASSN